MTKREVMAKYGISMICQDLLAEKLRWLMYECGDAIKKL